MHRYILRLLNVEKGSLEELELKKKLLQAELRLELNNDKLSSDQRRLLIQESFKERRELTDEFNAENKRKVLEDQASVISAQLAALNLSFEEREKLTVEQLEIERQKQLAAVVNNKTKEKEINAKFDKEIAEQRKTIREQAFTQELEDIKAANHVRQTLAERAAADESLPTNERIEALKEELRIEIDIITQKRFQNQQLLKDKLITIEEYNRRAKQLSNEEFDITSENQKAYTDIVESETEKRLKFLQETVSKIAGFAGQAVESLRGFLDTIAANEDNRINAQKDSLERLRENGVVSQKEYEARLKVIDRLDKQTKQRQAEREKSLALFDAFVKGAAAIVEAAPNPFAIAFTTALVAAQIAAIASRQVPKFGKGTKSAPKGFAEVGETGTELIQVGSKYFVADHPQVIWMKGGEKVYNPKETKEIFNSNIEFLTREVFQTPQANMTIVNNSQSHSVDGKVDYDKMAKKIGEEIARHPRSVISLDEDGFSVHITNKLNTQRYLNKRFTFND